MKIVFPIIFVLHICSITLFQHKHVVRGRVIVHSHPYKSTGADDSGHTHSYHELCFISHLSHIDSTACAFSGCVVAKPTAGVDEVVFSFSEDGIRSSAQYRFLLRAPPAVAFA